MKPKISKKSENEVSNKLRKRVYAVNKKSEKK